MNTTHTSDDCIFCKIASGEIPATKVFEDDETLAFLDIQPVSEGHVLVIPKDHFENIHTVPEETWCRLFLTVKKVATAVRHAVNADGINLEMNNEAAAGQIVMHAHVHIVPRHNDDGLKHWPGKAYKSPEEAQSIAEKIKEEIGK
jgi:histidine triad (HIT) family protein